MQYQRVILMKHTKHILISVLIFMTVFALSGCVTSTYNLTLKNNGDMDVDFTVLFDSTAADEISTGFLEEIKRQFSDIGYTIKEKSELGMNGFVISKKGIPQTGDGFIENSSYNVDILDDIMYNMEYDEKARCNEYELNGNIDLISFATIPVPVSQKLTQAEYTKLLSDMHLKLVVALEDGEIVSTNSQKVSPDKKTAEWVLIPGNSNHIELKAVMGVNTAWTVSMVIVSIIVLVMATFMLSLIKMYKKRNNKANT